MPPYKDEHRLLRAVEQHTRATHVPRWEVCAPFPCEAVRLANAHAGRGIAAGVRLWAVAGGILGLLAVAGWIYLTQFCADPLITQGRIQGWQSWPAYVVPLFEGTLLGAGLFTGIGFLSGAMLPKWYDWAFECRFFRTDERGEGYFILLAGGEELAPLAESLNPANLEHVTLKGGQA